MEKPPVEIRKPRSDDRRLWDVYWGAYGYFAVHIAHGEGVFTFLAEGPSTLVDICDAKGLKRRAAEAILSVCSAYGFLSLEDGQYTLTPLAEDYLLPDSPTYFGGQLTWNLSHPEIVTLDRLQRAVQTDSPQVYESGQEMFKTHEEEAAFAQQFTRAMHSASMGAATAWPEKLDLSSHQVMVDIGGGSGAHCIGAVSRWSNLRAVVLDRPPVCEVAREYAEQHGLSERLTTDTVDFWNDPYPDGDLHFYGMIFHDWAADKCRFMARKSFASLPSGGRMIVHEMLYDEDRAGPLGVAAFNMVMMMYTDGEQYSGSEIAGFLKDAGFADVDIIPTFGYWGIVTGRKL